MKANELMLGNLVEFKCQCPCHTHHDIMHFAACCSPREEIVLVEGVYEQEGHSGIFSKEGTKRYDLKELFPIPISIEWLEKLGFYGKYKSCGYIYRKGDFQISSQDEDDEGNEIKDYVLHFHYNWGNPPIYYVHQLQNLYFIVTGEQLKRI